MGGGTLAWGLAQRGIETLVLERGGILPREPENWSARAVFVERRYKPSETWLDDDGNEFHPGVHYLVGGNTKVYGASLPRLRERDLGQTHYPSGTSPAWPFTYDDLEPYYTQAESLYRVHGSVGEDPTEPWRSRPYPYPALAHEPYVAETMLRLAEQGLHPSSTAMGIDVRPGGTCVRCQTCDGFPCRLGAKSDAETCALGPAVAGGSVRLLTGARVRRVELDGSGRVARLVGDIEGEPFEVTGGMFVLSAGAANSAALLLASRSEARPTGVANSSGLVGRNYMVHNNTHLAAVDPRRRNDVVFQKTMAVNDFYHDLGDGHPGGTIQLIGKVQGSMMKTQATRAPLSLLNRMADRSVELLVMSEDLPSVHNRVTVGSDGRIQVSWRRTNYDRHEALLKTAKSVLRKAGYRGIFEQRFGIDMNSHMCGTAAAGHDPATSVLDPWCRSHDVPNLFVVDSSFFPSSGAQNPALTIAAQALRVAEETDWDVRV
ncbi:MAG: GMC family oxidoreductase [Actinobacteria bacterium]|nr:GMC family oxidoreductase [Actinomycetota bacterium]